LPGGGLWQVAVQWPDINIVRHETGRVSERGFDPVPIALRALAGGTVPLALLLTGGAAAAQPQDVASLVYTSGTLAMPKACMISHDSIMFVATSVLERFAATEDERMVSYLPLSHIAAAMLDIYGAAIVGFAVTMAQPDAQKGSLVHTMRAARPTIFFGVPRVYEKLSEKMRAVGAASGCCVRGISRWAKRVGAAATRAEEVGEPAPWGYAAARLMAFNLVRDALGLDACRFLVSAAAPVAPETLAYFASLNMPIHEVYGMSETTGPATACMPDRRRTGTCGRTLPGMEVAVFRVFTAADGSLACDTASEPLPAGAEGEVCMRGRHIMVGYKDDVAATAAAIDGRGWLHSGDLGRLDDDGFLTITGRAKELIKTAGGENIPPLRLENTIKEELAAVSHAVVVGDRRRYLVVLLALRTEMDGGGLPTPTLDATATAALAAAGCTAATVSEAATSAAFRAYIDAGLRRANDRAISNAQAVQYWHLLPRDLSVPGGELTPTLKIKRSVVTRMYAADIDAMYAAPTSAAL